jgi:peptidoglycan-associated lipoprotein
MAAAEGGKYPRKDSASILSRRTIYFDFDSAAIRDEFRPVIEAHAQFMKENKEARTILQGHTDERGSREYNIALGQRRAESVGQAMAVLGVPEMQVESVSLGEEKPVDEGHDEAAWQQNRRVEILYQGE